MHRVAVVGATGYAGAELVRILAGHPEVELTMLTSRQYAGQQFSQIYPSLANLVALTCETYDVEKICAAADLIFTALPHKLPMALVPELLACGKKVVDLSADFRFRDAGRYEAAYQPHSAKELLKEAVYGLSEIYRDQIAQASLVGNPGCYPTSVLLPLIPLIRAGVLDPQTIIADSKSGVSGAGRSPSLKTLFCEVHESYKAYKIAEHRHNPEMDEVLSTQAAEDVHITFVPHLVPMSRGMLSTVYAGLLVDQNRSDLYQILADTYAGRRFIRLRQDDLPPDTLHVRGTNFCDIGIRVDRNCGRLILMSAIDNLVKGAAGQAVQNMNIMLGLDETAGLLQIPYPI